MPAAGVSERVFTSERGSAQVRTGLVLIKVHCVWTQRTQRPCSSPLQPELPLSAQQMYQRQQEHARINYYMARTARYEKQKSVGTTKVEMLSQEWNENLIVEKTGPKVL